MANDFSKLVVAVQNSFVRVSREMLGLIPGVMLDPQSAQAALGQQVIFGQAPKNTTAPIVPGVVPPQPADQDQESVELAITDSESSELYLTGEEWASLDNLRQGYKVASIDQAVRAMSNRVEQDLFDASYAQSGIAVGTPATTPFGSNLSDAFLVERTHNDLATIQGGRRLVINSAAKQNLGDLTQLTNVNNAGDDAMLRRSIVNPIAGYDIGWSFFTPNAVPVGTGAAYEVVGAQVAGATSFDIDTGAGTVLAGDIVSFVGDATLYGVRSFVGATLTLNTGLKLGLADNAVMTISAAATRNLAFAEDTIRLATRWPKLPEGGDSASNEAPVVDPMTGIIYRLAEYKGFHQTSWFLELAWGSQVMKRDDLVTLLG